MATRLLRVARLGVGVASAAALAAHNRRAQSAAAPPPPPEGADDAAAAAEPKTKTKTCLQLTLLPESTTDVLDFFKAEYARIVADRVLVRPCMTEEIEPCPLRPLAYVRDGSTQSLLIVPSVPLWVGEADISSSGRVGYPVLPISIAEEQDDAPARTTVRSVETLAVRPAADQVPLL